MENRNEHFPSYPPALHARIMRRVKYERYKPLAWVGFVIACASFIEDVAETKMHLAETGTLDAIGDAFSVLSLRTGLLPHVAGLLAGDLSLVAILLLAISFIAAVSLLGLISRFDFGFRLPAFR